MAQKIELSALNIFYNILVLKTETKNWILNALCRVEFNFAIDISASLLYKNSTE